MRIKSNGSPVSNAIFKIISYTFLTVFAIICIFPFYNVLVISLSSPESFARNPLMLYPLEINFGAYKEIFADEFIVRGFVNSLIVCGLGLVYNMFLMVTTAYVLTQNKVRGVKTFFIIIIITMFFNGGLIPTYLLIKNLNLINTFGAIILPAGMNIFYMIILFNSFRSIPPSLVESATIDGANELVVLWKIVLPVCVPSIMAIVTFTFVDKWNEWYSTMLYIKDPTLFPLTYVLKTIVAQVSNATDIGMAEVMKLKKVFPAGMQRATIIFTILPIMLIYPFVQKYFASGIMLGAVKE